MKKYEKLLITLFKVNMKLRNCENINNKQPTSSFNYMSSLNSTLVSSKTTLTIDSKETSRSSESIN